MTVHIIKLCVGVDSIEELAQWQKGRLAAQKAAGQQPRLFHRTRMVPKRQAELLDGGSLYWVIKGVIQVRQRITGFGDVQKPDGVLSSPPPRRPRPPPVSHNRWRTLRRRGAGIWRGGGCVDFVSAQADGIA